MAGPCFGFDMNIVTYSSNESRDDRVYDRVFCRKTSYEEKIRNTEDNFSMEDYEVFQIIKK